MLEQPHVIAGSALTEEVDSCDQRLEGSKRMHHDDAESATGEGVGFTVGESVKSERDREAEGELIKRRKGRSGNYQGGASECGPLGARAKVQRAALVAASLDDRKVFQGFYQPVVFKSGSLRR